MRFLLTSALLSATAGMAVVGAAAAMEVPVVAQDTAGASGGILIPLLIPILAAAAIASSASGSDRGATWPLANPNPGKPT